MGCHFKATNEEGKMFPGDVEFHKMLEENRLETLKAVCGIKLPQDVELFSELKRLLS